MSTTMDISRLMVALGACVLLLIAAPVSGASMCGDGTLDAGEECDDGNLTGGDCCSPTCLFEPPSTVCRAAAGACDLAETCSGTSGVCPADAFVASGIECRAASGPCDLPESCSGASKSCPADAFASSGTACRAAAGPCDEAEACDGASSACPPDELSPATVECRPALAACDRAERCSGTSVDCPLDEVMSAGTPCADDGIGCTTDACDGAGACLHSPHDSLCAAAPCAIGRCDANAGCTDSPAPDGTGCDDGDDCTADDRCTAGQCTPGLRRCATVSSHPSGIAVDCVARGHRKGACSAQAFLASGSGVGEALSRVVRRRIGRRDGAHLVLKLSREGRRLLAALGGLVRVTVEIVVSRDGEGTILRRTIDLTAR